MFVAPRRVFGMIPVEDMSIGTMYTQF